MSHFTVVSRRYRDFTLLVSVAKTAFGFKCGDLVKFEEYRPGDRFPHLGLLAVTPPGEPSQVQIGQILTWNSWCEEGRTYRKIRLWNDQVGDAYRDFDIQGVMILPSQTSWQERVRAGMQIGPRCCPQDYRACQSLVAPCRPECAYIENIGIRGVDEECWDNSRELGLCSRFAELGGVVCARSAAPDMRTCVQCSAESFDKQRKHG